VVIQVIMVALAIAFPAMIMHYKGAGSGVNPADIEINIPGNNDNNNGGGLQLPDFSAPPPPSFN